MDLQAPSAEARELWKGFIRSVAEVGGVELTLQKQRTTQIIFDDSSLGWPVNISSSCACVSLQLSVPSSLNLLPGQIHMLKEAVEKEKERIKLAAAAIDSSTYITLQADMPAWVQTGAESIDAYVWVKYCFYLAKLKGTMLQNP